MKNISITSIYMKNMVLNQVLLKKMKKVKIIEIDWNKKYRIILNYHYSQ